MQSGAIYLVARHTDFLIVFRRFLLRTLVRNCPLFKRLFESAIGLCGFAFKSLSIPTVLRRQDVVVLGSYTHLFEYKHFGASINIINMRNVEIKASIRDWKTINDKAKELSGSEPTTIQQKDTFFKAQKGRLKLRRFEDGSGELIFYERPDTLEPKLSDYKKMDLSVANCQEISDLLTESNGVLGTVEKTRFLYIVGQSRVHIDAVLNLGTFLEIEVVLSKDQNLEAGQKITQDLMEKLGIQSTDLISKAYLDLLLDKTR